MKRLFLLSSLFLLSGCAEMYGPSTTNPQVTRSGQGFTANYGNGASSKATVLRTFKRGSDTCYEYLNEIKAYDGEMKYFSTVCQEPSGRRYTLSKKEPHYVKRY